MPCDHDAVPAFGICTNCARAAAADRIPPPLMNQSQAAKFLGVGVRTIRKWMRDGLLPVRRCGARAWVCRDAALRALAEELPEAQSVRAMLRRRSG